MQDDAIIERIQSYAKATKADPNPDELEHLKKLIKQNVPFTLRGYFMAYLLRSLTQAPARRPQHQNRSQRPFPPKAAPAEKSAEAPSGEAAAEAPAQKPKREPQPLPEGAKTLYLNIGKMKKLFVKDLSQIIQDTIGCTREDIYAIRIHDKYSFVSMSQENCEKAIEKMNGMDIKGRIISVTYSNKE